MERLARLEEYVRLLEGLRGRDVEDPYMRGALERYFHLAAEATLDVDEMLIARLGLPKASTYREVIRNLGRAAILPAEFAERFERVASLRNILVHDYARVDPAELQRHLARLDDFRAFARHVSARLAK